MRNYIVQEKNIEVIIPMNDIITGKLNELVNQGVILDLAVGRFRVEDVEYKQVFFNFLDDKELELFLTMGYEVNWLRPYNYPFIELDEDTDISIEVEGEQVDMYVFEPLRQYKDGKMLIRIDKAGDSLTPLEPTFNELKAWNKLGSIICNPALVKIKMEEYIGNDDYLV